MGIDYLESLFTGMDIIIDKRLKELSFDKTIVCTVVNNENKKNGEYRVSDGAIEFIAYSDSNKYQINDQVLVKIPQGDYTKEKFIEGRYVNDNNTSPITYISPLDTIVNISGNLVDNSNIQYGIVANGDLREKIIWAKGFIDEPLSKITGDGIYDTITLRANFRTLLNDYHLYEGRYGLKLEIYTKASKDSNTLFLNTVILDSSEMFGNPYMFSVYSRQEKSFLINTEGYIHALKLILYQDGKFKDILKNELIFGKDISDNILVKDIELGIGSDLTKVSDNTLKLYTVSDPQYKYYGWLPETNDKQLGLLWYNKNDNNKFLGFSDGIYDEAYDEKEYLKKVADDARIKAQLGRDEMPTDEFSLTLAANIEEGSQGVIQAKNLIIKDFHQELINLISQLPNSLKSDIQDFDDKLSENYGDLIEEELENIQNDYKLILKFGYDEEQGLTPEKPKLKGSLEKLKGYFTDFNEKVKTLLSGLSESIKENYEGYQGIYDTYEIRLNKLLKKIDKVDELTFFNDNLKEYKRGKPYKELDLSGYANRYSIYWYRYNKTALGDEFMPSGWESFEDVLKSLPEEEQERLKMEKKFIADFGLPGLDIETGFYQVALPAGTYNIITMRHDQQEEKFVVVLFYNHVMYKSNELVFTNADEVPDKATLDMSDALLIEHLDNSYDNYYIYNLTNNLNNIADKSIHRQLRCHYDGLLAGDDILTQGEIYWYIPNNDNSMLTVDDKFLRDKGFSTDKNGKTQLSINGYDYYYKKIGEIQADENNPGGYISNSSIDYRDFWYMIKPYYSHTAKNNNIICKVKLNGKYEYLQASILLSFGIEGTSGTHYTLVITNSEPNRVSTIPTQDNEDIFKGSLKLNISVRDYENEKIPIIKGNVANGNNVFLTDSNIDWLFSLSENKDFNLNIFADTNEVTGINIATNKCGILKTIVGLSNPDQDGKFMDLTSLYPVPYSNNPDYYISGPTHIIYNSLGTLDNMSMFNQKYRLWSYSDNSEIKNITWKIEYYTEDGIIDDSTDEKLKIFYENYMPKLSEDNKLIPAPMYLDKIEEECWAVVKALRGSDILWLQPIIILQNRYSSSLLNDWDGSFQIDEESGTILSTMIGAGRKTIDNTFEGVLMGDVGAAAGVEIPPHKTGLGIYGFNDGAQSFGLNIDGTAFFGKSGRGRIEINGNSGIISSASYQQNVEKAGMLIDLDDGFIDILGAKQNKDGSYSEDGTKSHIRIDSKSPYVQIISEKNRPLLYISNNEYYLQTNDYEAGSKGLKIDLKDGKLDAYSFSLNAGTDATGKVQLNSNPAEDGNYLFVGKKDDNDKNQFIQLTKSGDLSISATDFTLNTDNIYLSATPNSDNLIFKVGDKFKIDKDGTLNATGGNFTGTITGSSININNKFKVSSEGYMTSISGNIAGWEIGDGYLRNGKTDEDGIIQIYSHANSPSLSFADSGNKTDWKLTIGTYFGVDSNGHLYCRHGTFKGTIYATNGEFSGDISGATGTFKGTLSLNGATLKGGSATGTLYIDPNLNVFGQCWANTVRTPKLCVHEIYNHYGSGIIFQESVWFNGDMLPDLITLDGPDNIRIWDGMSSGYLNLKEYIQKYSS